MIGTLINTAAIIAGGFIGMIFKKNLAEKYVNIYFQAVGIFTIMLGVKMGFGMNNPLIVVLSLACGGLCGEYLKLEERTENLSNKLKSRLHAKNEQFTEGFITSTLLFCMGSMSVIGAIEEGFGKTSDLLLTKSILDGFSAMLLASAFGSSVLFASISVLLYQGIITLFVYLFARDIPNEYIVAITSVGGILLIGLGINILKIKNLKIVNLLPSLVFICFFLFVYRFLALL